MTEGRPAHGRPEPPRHHFRPPDPALVREVPSGSGPAVRGPRAPRPWWALVLGQWPLAITLLGVAVGVGIMGTGYWRRGATAIGLTISVAAALRWLLPERIAGLLVVRSRWFDALVLAVLGVGILVTAWVVPPIRR